MPVSLSMSLSRPRSSAPPPVRVMPWSMMSADWLFFYYMPGYAGAGERFLWVVLPSALMTAPGSWLLHRAVQRISREFKIDNGVV